MNLGSGAGDGVRSSLAWGIVTLSTVWGWSIGYGTYGSDSFYPVWLRLGRPRVYGDVIDLVKTFATAQGSDSKTRPWRDHLSIADSDLCDSETLNDRRGQTSQSLPMTPLFFTLLIPFSY